MCLIKLENTKFQEKRENLIIWHPEMLLNGSESSAMTEGTI